MRTARQHTTRLERQERNRLALSTDHLTATLGRRAAQGGSVAMGAQGVRLLVQLTGSAILARLLEPADFGLVAMAITITAFVGMFTDLGLTSAAVQRKHLEQDTASGLLLVNMLMGFAIMATAIAVAPLAAHLFDDERVFWLVAVMAGTIPVGALAAQQHAILQRRMAWTTLQIITLSGHILGVAVSILLAWKTDLGYWALVANSWVAALVSCGAAWAVSPWRPSRVHDWSGVRQSLHFGIFLTGFGFVNYFHRQADNVLIGWRFGAMELGYYGRAYALFFLPTSSLMWPFAATAKSVLARVADDPPRYCAALQRMLLPLTILVSCAGGIAHFGAHSIITLFYGNRWAPSVDMFAILALCLPVQSLIVSQGWLYISSGRTKAMFHAQIFSSACFLTAFAIAVHISLEAVAAAYAMTSLLLCAPVVWLATRGSNLSFRAYAKVQFMPPAAAFAGIGITHLFLPASAGSDLATTLSRISIYLLIYICGLGLAAFVGKDFGSVLRDLLRRTAGFLANARSRVRLGGRREERSL